MKILKMALFVVLFGAFTTLSADNKEDVTKTTETITQEVNQDNLKIELNEDTKEDKIINTDEKK